MINPNAFMVSLVTEATKKGIDIESIQIKDKIISVLIDEEFNIPVFAMEKLDGTGAVQSNSIEFILDKIETW